LTKTKAIHVPTEQYRIVSLAETAALEGDGDKSFALLSVANALNNIPHSISGYLELHPTEDEVDS
jgi:hypothetical protein